MLGRERTCFPVSATLVAMMAACTHHNNIGTQQNPPDADASRRDSSARLPHPDAPPGASTSDFCLDPGQLDAGPPEAPISIFEVTGCLWHTLASGRALAVFSWSNQTGQEQAAPYGPENHVSPGSDAQGQPTSFLSDRQGKFAVPFDGSLATWTILEQSVTVSQTSPDCGSACLQIYYPGCMDCAPIATDICSHACGDGVCDDVETCKSCPADCDCSSLYPLVDCVIPLDGGKKLVSFGYSNSAATRAGLEIGPDNEFLSGQPTRGQPVIFEVGEHHSVFQVTYGGPDVTWALAGNAVTVSSDTPLCSQNCGSTCPTGTTCVADQCQGSCGDGLCVEGCGDCPDDCACGGDNVCLGYACGTPPRCGGDGPECGIAERFGIRVDCGPCPEGQGCDRNLCFPICPVGP